VAKLTLSNLSSLQNETSALATINANSDLIETALENTLSRDGTSPNAMEASLDMNNNRILNLPAPVADQEPLRLVDGQALVDAAELAQDGAEAALASFQDIWLGNQTGDPSTDLNLSALDGGEIYYNTVSKTLRVYGLGIGWVDVAPFDDLTQIAAYVLAAAASAAAALTSENSAADSADAALADKIAAAASAVAAASSASTAEVMRDQAVAAAAAAAASALEASGHSDDAETAKTAAEAALDSFTDIYLGEKNGAPLLDNDGNALLVGALYYDTGDQQLKFYNGTVWFALTTTGLANVSDDIDPELGNHLDLNNFDIFGTGNIDITGGVSTLNSPLIVRNNDMGVGAIDDQYGTEFTTGVFAINSNIQYGMLYYAGGNSIFTVWQEFIKSRNTDGSGFTAVQSGDELMRFNALGDDGNSFEDAASLIVTVDGTVSNGIVPARWDFSNQTSAGVRQNNLTIRADRSIDMPGAVAIGGLLSLPASGYNVGTSNPFLDSAGVLTLRNVDALDATTEATVEAAIDTLANLTSIQGVTFTFGSYAATLLNNTSEATFKAATNLEIGVDVQAFDADLSSIAGLSPSNDDIIQRKADAWTNRTMAQLIADLAALGTTFQPLDSDLTSWAGVTRASGFDTFAATPSLANLGSLLTDEAAGLITFMTTPSSANLRSLLTDETGSGVLYFQGGDAGTPSAIVLTNGTGLPLTGLVSDTTTAVGVGSINVGHASDTTVTRASAGKVAVEGSNVLMESGNSHKVALVITISGGGAAITTGTKGDVRVPWAGTITKQTTLIDQTGSIVVDLWKDTYANYPPTDADSITASAPPTISSGLKQEDSTLTGWTTSVAAGDTIRWNVDSITTATWCTIILEITKTQ
jgi:hypothetical protein